MRNKLLFIIAKYLCITLQVLTVTTAFAQIQAQTSISQVYDQNPFRLVEQEASWISNFEIGLQYDFNAVALSYEGNFTRFDRLLERNFYWHQFSLSGGGEKTNWNILLEQTLNGVDYEFYDHRAAIANLYLKFTPRLFNLFLSGSFTYNIYPQIAEINNFLLYAQLRLHKSFPSRTTLIGGSGVSYKYYTNPLLNVEPQLSIRPVPTIYEGGYRGGFGGNGGAAQLNSAAETRYASQVQFWLRLAQSVFSTTGLAVQYQQWISLNGYNRSLSGIIYDYNDESSIFDDPLGYHLQSAHVELTQLLPYYAVLKLSYDQEDKQYTTQGIYTDPAAYSANILRADNQNYFSISLQKSIQIQEMILDVELRAEVLKNNSNSYWYNYESAYAGIMLNWYF
jgi:hypothetical protein